MPQCTRRSRTCCSRRTHWDLERYGGRGDAAYHPFVKQIFGLSDREAMAGFIYVGYPDIKVPMRKRAAVEDKTVWFD